VGVFGTLLIVDTFVSQLKERTRSEDPFRMVLGVWEVFGRGIMDILVGEIQGVRYGDDVCGWML
jgi:hypothetical protein